MRGMCLDMRGRHHRRCRIRVKSRPWLPVLSVLFHMGGCAGMCSVRNREFGCVSGGVHMAAMEGDPGILGEVLHTVTTSVHPS